MYLKHGFNIGLRCSQVHLLFGVKWAEQLITSLSVQSKLVGHWLQVTDLPCSLLSAPPVSSKLHCSCSYNNWYHNQYSKLLVNISRWVVSWETLSERDSGPPFIKLLPYTSLSPMWLSSFAPFFFVAPSFYNLKGHLLVNKSFQQFCPCMPQLDFSFTH